MLTLYSYPGLFGLADNNAFGLKVFAVLRIAGIAFHHEHIIDTSEAPHGQLPYIQDGGTILGDSTAIVDHLIRIRGLALDSGLTEAQRFQAFSVNRVLDDLYWPMSYSRWKDDRFWLEFRAAMLEQISGLTEKEIEDARSYNFERYRLQGIGRYAPDEAYRRGIDDLRLVASMLGNTPFAFGIEPTSVDASIYGFIANILFYPIETPLRAFVLSQPHLERHCRKMHQLCTPAAGGVEQGMSGSD
jgi:glutathione S-transferase